MPERNTYNTDGAESDSELYNRVTENGINTDGLEAQTERGPRSLEEAIKDRSERKYMVCRNRNIHATAEAWIPLDNTMRISVGGRANRFYISGTDFAITTHTAITTALPDGDNDGFTDIYKVSKHALLKHVRRCCGNAESVVGEATPVIQANNTPIGERALYRGRLPYHDELWIHASSVTDITDNYSSWEAYIPAEDALVSTGDASRSGRLIVPWSNDMILRYTGTTHVNSITSTQDGLYVSNLHFVTEEDVPVEYDGESQYDDYEVSRMDVEVETVGERYRNQ
jgi:hypothetical protein